MKDRRRGGDDDETPNYSQFKMENATYMQKSSQMKQSQGYTYINTGGEVRDNDMDTFNVVGTMQESMVDGSEGKIRQKNIVGSDSEAEEKDDEINEQYDVAADNMVGSLSGNEDEYDDDFFNTAGTKKRFRKTEKDSRDDDDGVKQAMKIKLDKNGFAIKP